MKSSVRDGWPRRYQDDGKIHTYTHRTKNDEDERKAGDDTMSEFFRDDRYVLHRSSSGAALPVFRLWLHFPTEANVVRDDVK